MTKKLVAPPALLKGREPQDQRSIAGYLDEINKRIEALEAALAALTARVAALEGP
jgi:hypothetical protein